MRASGIVGVTRLGGIEIDHQLEFVLRVVALPGPK
jgi:hypothetical protein